MANNVTRDSSGKIIITQQNPGPAFNPWSLSAAHATGGLDPMDSASLLYPNDKTAPGYRPPTAAEQKQLDDYISRK